MHELKQSTATTILIGPFLDDTDGKSPETTIDVATIDCDLYKGITKSDLSLTSSGGANDCVHVVNGYYSLELTAGNLDTLADGRVAFNVTGAMPFWEDLMIVTANYFDSKCSTDKLEVDLIQMGGVAQSATDLKDFVDEGYDPAYHALSPSAIRRIWEDLVVGQTKSGSLGLLIRNNLNASVSSRNSVEPDPAGTLATYDPPTNTEMVAAFTEIKGSTFVTGTDSLEALRNRGDDAWITASGFSTHSAANVWSSVTRSLTDKAEFSLSTSGIKAIWDQLTSGLTTIGSLGKLLVDNINATISSRNAIAPNTVIPDIAGTAATLHGTTDGKIDVVDGIVDTIKAKTDNLPSGITKGEALPKFDFLMVLSSDHITGATGKSITGEISKDGGGFTGITNIITEVSNGMYTIASGFTSIEMNANIVTLKFDAVDCDTRIITIVTN